VKAKLRETAGYVLAMSILVLNLRKIQSAFLRLVLLWLGSLVPQENWLLFSRHYIHNYRQRKHAPVGKFNLYNIANFRVPQHSN
jgi:hypothetical protein